MYVSPMTHMHSLIKCDICLHLPCNSFEKILCCHVEPEGATRFKDTTSCYHLWAESQKPRSLVFPAPMQVGVQCNLIANHQRLHQSGPAKQGCCVLSFMPQHGPETGKTHNQSTAALQDACKYADICAHT